MNGRAKVFCALCAVVALLSWLRPSPAPADDRVAAPSYGDLHMAIMCVPLPNGANSANLNFAEVLPGFAGKRIVSVNNALTGAGSAGTCNLPSGSSPLPTSGIFTTIFYQDP